MYNASKYSTRLAIAIMYWAATVTEELEQINSHYLSNTCMYIQMNLGLSYYVLACAQKVSHATKSKVIQTGPANSLNQVLCA